MNLREAIGEYAVRYAQCQEVIGWDGEGAERIRRQFGESVDRLCRVVEVAEAAIAHAEFQVSSHSRNGDDAPMDGATYIRERGKLWDAFMEARARAKATNQS